MMQDHTRNKQTMCQKNKTKDENKMHLQKSMAKKKALSNQTALDKAVNNIKLASIIYSTIYNSIKIGRQSLLINLTLFFFL